MQSEDDVRLHDSQGAREGHYPIATYQVIDSYENLGRKGDHIREDHPNVELDLNLAEMSAEERITTVNILQRALDRLSRPDTPSRDE